MIEEIPSSVQAMAKKNVAWSKSGRGRQRHARFLPIASEFAHRNDPATAQ